jgi:GMP synthase (glutamine-hydrolysing)
VRVPVIDNGGQWTHREWRVLKYLKVETEILPNTTPIDEIKADGLVLSGGAASVDVEYEKLGRLGEYFDKATVPILAICVAHQFMGQHYGGRVGKAVTGEFGKTEITVDDHDEILAGLPAKFTAWESHNDEVKEMPDGLVRLAHSEACVSEAMRHRSKPFFGVQFHPEVEHTEHGEAIFKNFLSICRK